MGSADKIIIMYTTAIISKLQYTACDDIIFKLGLPLTYRNEAFKSS